MSFFKSVKNAGQKTKLRGEIALLDRELKARQGTFGVELYDLLVKLSKKSLSSSFKTPSIFHATQSQIKAPFEQCESDIKPLLNQMDAHEQELIHLECNREVGKGGNPITEAGTEAKLHVQIKMLEREIRQRKEKFGVDVCETLAVETTTTSKSAAKSPLSSVKSNLASRLSKMSKSETEIQECIDEVKRDAGLIQSQIDSKVKIIARLDAGR